MSRPCTAHLRHVYGHTNHCTAMIHTLLESPSDLMCIPGFVFQYSKTFRRNWRLNVHYMAMSCSRRDTLRYVCGQTIYPTAMICKFLESPTDLDLHPGKRVALFFQNSPNWRHRRAPKATKICSLRLNCLLCSYVFCIYCVFTCCWHTGDDVRLSDVVKLVVSLGVLTKMQFLKTCNNS